MKRQVSIAVGGIALLAAVYVMRIWQRVEWRQATAETPVSGAALEELSGDFQAASRHLSVSLRPAEQADDDLVARRDMPGILSILVYDLPEMLVPVHPAYLDNWSRGEEEVFRTALENVRNSPQPKIGDVELPGCGTVKVLLGENYSTAAHALLLEEHPECLGAFGALVAVPNLHTVLCFPISDRRVAPAVPLMARMVARIYRPGPEAVSDGLFLYSEGTYSELAYSLDGSTLTLEMPAAFIKLLGRIEAAGNSQPGAEETGNPDSVPKPGNGGTEVSEEGLIPAETGEETEPNSLD